VDLEVFFYLGHVKNLYTIQYNTMTTPQTPCWLGRGHYLPIYPSALRSSRLRRSFLRWQILFRMFWLMQM